MWIVGEWSDYETGPTRIAVWSHLTDAQACKSAWESECAGCGSIRIELWDAVEDSGKCPWEDSGRKDAERKAVLNKAIQLIEKGDVECLFDALQKATDSDWNGGFGKGANMVRWNNGNRRSHVAYAATRLALSNPNQALMCFSQSASKEEMIDVLERAKKVEVK